MNVIHKIFEFTQDSRPLCNIFHETCEIVPNCGSELYMFKHCLLHSLDQQAKKDLALLFTFIIQYNQIFCYLQKTLEHDTLCTGARELVTLKW